MSVDMDHKKLHLYDLSEVNEHITLYGNSSCEIPSYLTCFFSG